MLKRSELVFVALAVLTIFVGLAFLNGLTGAAVQSDIVSVPGEDENYIEFVAQNSVSDKMVKFDLGAQADISACGTLSVGQTYTLTQNVASAGTCFTINAHNVILDCQGYSITYAQSSIGYGIDNSAAGDYFEVKNCVFIQDSSADTNSHAIYSAAGGEYSQIHNNSITLSKAYGIYAGDRSSVYNNTVTATSSADGIEAQQFSEIYNNTITSANDGISLTNCFYCGVYNNSIDITTAGGKGIYYPTTYTNITSNNITGDGNGIWDVSFFTRIEHNYINVDKIGIDLHIHATGSNYINNNTINTTGEYAYAIQSDGNENNIIVNNTIVTSDVGSTAIVLIDTTNITLIENNISTPWSVPIYINGSTEEHYNLTEADNIINDLELLYNLSLSDQVVLDNYDASNVYGQIICANCNNVTYSNVIVGDGGICLYESPSSTIYNSTFLVDRSHAIFFSESDYANISRNEVNTTNREVFAIYLLESDNANINDNDVFTNGSSAEALTLEGSSDANIVGNNLTAGTVSVSAVANGAAIHLKDSSEDNWIYNNNLTAEQANAYAAYVENSEGNEFDSNHLFTPWTSSNKYVAYVRSSNTRFYNNDIRTTCINCHAMYFLGQSSSPIRDIVVHNNTIVADVIIASNGVRLYYVENGSFVNNYIYAQVDNGVYIRSVANTTFGNNTIIADSSSGIYLHSQDVLENSFINNNITASSSEISDNSADDDINYLGFNNSYGTILWWGDLAYNGELPEPYLYIGNNTLAFNATEFPQFNRSANITLYGLPFSRITGIYKVDNYTADQNAIVNDGSDCLGTTCEVLSLGYQELTFNVTNTSSFSVVGDYVNTAPYTTYVNIGTWGGLTTTNQDLSCYAKGEDGEYNKIVAYYNWTRDGEFFSSGSAIISNDTTTIISVLDSSNTGFNEEWNCTVWMGDGLVNESSSNSDNITIDPVSCSSTISRSYTLDSDLLGCNGTGITITGNDVVLDCDGFSITGNGTSSGIYAYDIDNLTIKNCNLGSFINGIRVSYGSNHTYHNNAIYNTTYGVYVTGSSSSFNNYTQNTIYNTTYSMYNYGYNSTYYNNTVYNGTYGIYLINPDNNTVDSNTVYNFSERCITLVGNSADYYDNVVIGNYVNDCQHGIRLRDSLSTNVFNNTMTNCSYGYTSYRSISEPYDNISFNNVSNNEVGIKITYNNSGSYNNIYDNSLNLEAVNSVSMENNYWSFTDCTDIEGNISGTVDFDPYLDDFYPTGNPTICLTQYCEMIITNDLTLDGDIQGCNGTGITITANDVVLDCNGHLINATDENNDSGVYFGYDKKNIVVKNCRINNFAEGVYVGARADNANVSNNSIINSIFGIRDGGQFSSDDPHYFGYNNISHGRSNSIGIGSNDSIVIQSRIEHNNIQNFTYGVSACWNCDFFNNTLVDNYVGHYLNKHPFWSNYTNETLLNNSIAVLINTSLGSTQGITPVPLIFTDSTFENNTLDLDFVNAQLENITFVNSSVNDSKMNVYELGYAYVKWYVDVNVSNINGNQLSGASVKAINSIDEVEDIIETGSDGLARTTVTSFYRNDDINYHITPTTFRVTKENYIQNETSFNLYNQTYGFVNVTLTEIDCNSTINGNVNFGSNFSCNETALIIGTDNVVIDGNGYALFGNGSNIGIDLNGKQNVVISNLTLNNFTQAVYFEGTNNNQIYGLELTNNTYGVVFNNSDNNTISDSVIENNSAGVFSINNGGTENYLVNVSIDPDDINVSGTAQVYVQWYVDVNATYNNLFGLGSATISGISLITNTTEDTGTTDGNGEAQLILSEWKKNITGVYNLTPHNITLLFNAGSDIVNSTIINLTETNNTEVHLDIDINCTTPALVNNVSTDTTFCPGSYDINSLTLADDITLTCLGTTLDTGFDLYSQDNVTIVGCNFYDSTLSTTGRITLSNTTNIRFENISAYNGRGLSGFAALRIIGSNNISLIGSNFTHDTHSIRIQDNTENVLIEDCVLQGGTGLYLSEFFNSNITGNHFKDLNTGIEFISANNTYIYNNYFEDTADYVYEYFDTSATGYVNYFNVTVSNGTHIFGQGNEYSDYCDMGSDANGDGYADNTSSASEWPYSENISSKISDPTPGNAGVIDYGPKITTCPAEEVFLGGDSGGSSSAVETTGEATEVVEVVERESKKKKDIEDYLTADEVRENLNEQLKQTTFDEKVTRVTFVLENTGNKRMSLFPELLQSHDDPFFIVKTKTLGYEGSLFDKIAHLSYSDEPVTGKLMDAEIVDPEQIILEPGQSLTKTLEIKEELTFPRLISIQFTTHGETVVEKEVEIEKKAISGTAIDLDSSNDVLDLYAVMVPAEEGLEEYFAEKEREAITSAAVVDLSRDYDEFMLELNFNKKLENGKLRTSFNDLYGPYQIKPGQAFVFAQQFNYDPEVFTGEYIVNSKILKNGKAIVKNNFDVVFE